MVKMATPHDDFYFLREGVVDIDAAVVGISKSRWIGISEAEAKEDNAAKIMRKRRFDILPVVSSDGSVRDYFRAGQWGDYSAVLRASITHRDVVALNTHIRDILKSFVADKRHFFFLTNDDRIVGLVSIANFNCRQVKIYLFSLISELELRLGEFLAAEVTDKQMMDCIVNGQRERNAQNVKQRFENDRAAGVEVPLVEYLYLSQLFEIVIAKQLHGLFGSKSEEQFKNWSSAIEELRNQVAHPAKSLIVKPDSCEKLWATVDAIEEALFKLRHLPQRLNRPF